MVFPAEAQPRYTYLLWHPFKYPTANGHEAAIAVSKNWGDSINSVYSVLFEILLIQALQFLVLVFIYIGNRSSSDFIHLANTLFYENEPTTVVLRMLNGLTGRGGGRNPIWLLSQHSVRGYERIALLISVGLTLLLVPKILPAFAIHSLLIGTAAPVDPVSIYIPHSAYFRNYTDAGMQIPLEVLSRPRILRAVGQVETASADLQAKVSVTPPVVLHDLGKGEKILKVDYNYSLKAHDFGLQNFHGLELSVTGSCRTEYGWLNSSYYDYYDAYGLPTDFYYIFNDTLTYYSASPLYGYMPIAYAQYIGMSTNMNKTYAIMISSMQCQSITIGTDPWYLTETTGAPWISANNDTVYNVRRGRPGLSCWESDEWTYKGQSSSTWNLPNVSGLNFPAALRDVFYTQMGTPSIYNMAVSLGSIALQSSTITQYFTIDAGNSSIYNDIRRLVLTSYIATTNLLLDTTLYDTNNTYGMSSIVSPDELDQVAKFVVSDQQIATISLAFAIALPIGTLLLFVMVKSLKYYIKPKVLDGGNGTSEAVVKIDAAGKA
ncbi:hypothetical protein ZTR_10817 [Talaromyces verruculosus]|nr:hypothetical protein ZTR_10817 [Talaromyces verruculosus]